MNAIEPSDAQAVLNSFGYGATNDEFTEQLLSTMMRADVINFSRLGRAYPGLAEALDIIRKDENGISILRGIAQPLTAAA